jgi:DNA repair protein RadC
MLSRYGGLVGLLAADRAILTENTGIGEAKAARFVGMKKLSQWHMLVGIQSKDILTALKQLEIVCAQNSGTARYLVVYFLTINTMLWSWKSFFAALLMELLSILERSSNVAYTTMRQR